MSFNSFGHLFRFTTWGESHGPAIGCVVDGVPPRIALSEADIQPWLDRRRPGQSRFTTQRRESDQVRILSGLFEGRTTGTPISLLIDNEDQRSKDYTAIKDQFRPGHADYTYWRKYGLRDPRGGGRASARLTAPMVAAGAVAKKWLHQQHGTRFVGWMSQLDDIEIPFVDEAQIAGNPFFAPNAAIVPQLEAHGYRVSGRTPTENLPEIMELPSHPFFIGVQFHPEFTSTPRNGHPLFSAFVNAALAFREARREQPTPMRKAAA